MAHNDHASDASAASQLTRRNVEALPSDSMLPTYLHSLRIPGKGSGTIQLRMPTHRVEEVEANKPPKGNDVEVLDRYMASITDEKLLKDEGTAWTSNRKG